MFFSLGIILLSALLAASLCKKLRLPPLIGMLAVGIAIGPYALNLIDGSILGISGVAHVPGFFGFLLKSGFARKVF